MRIQIIKNKYKLPFNPNKPVFPYPYEPKIKGDIITVYIIMPNTINPTQNNIKYYSIAKVIDTIYHNMTEYYLFQHKRRKRNPTDNKLIVVNRFDSYNEAKTYMKCNFLSQECNGIYVDIINIRKEE